MAKMLSRPLALLCSCMVLPLALPPRTMGQDPRSSGSAGSASDPRADRFLRERWDSFVAERARPVEFDPEASSPEEVFAVAGRDLHISCGFTRRLSGGMKVSFLRLRDLNLLSVGKKLHTPEWRRMEVINTKEAPRMWTLKIRLSTPLDSGPYECQLNTDPAPLRRVFAATVVRSHVTLLPAGANAGANATTVTPGDDLRLTCLVHAGPLAPSRITWYKDDRLVEYSADIRARVSTTRLNNSTGGYSSELFIARVREEDSGLYRCDSDLGGEARVAVSVLGADVLKSLQQQREGVFRRSKVVGGFSGGSSRVMMASDATSWGLSCCWVLVVCAQWLWSS